MAGQFIENLYAGRAFQGFHYDEVLFKVKTDYQTIQIFQTGMFGRVLVLDGIVQTTEADEFIYHEMLAHVPMLACESPQTVLIVGGGDGGALREVLKHPVTRVDMVEIDQAVIDSARQYLPSLNDHGRAFDDPRTQLVVRDAFEYLKEHRGEYDVILIDSTDPIGAAEALYSNEFYRLCTASLTPGGVMSIQDGVVFFQREEIGMSVKSLSKCGLRAGAYITAVPTYYGGVMTFGIAGHQADALTPNLASLQQRAKFLAGQTRHYSPAIHHASFTLPPWIADAVEGKCDAR